MQSNEFQIVQLLYYYNDRAIQSPRGEPLPVDDTRTNQSSDRTEATLLQQPPKRTANPITYHRDSAALDKDQSQTKTVTNRRLCCHNHRPASLSYRDRPVSRQQPNRQNPKIMSMKPSPRRVPRNSKTSQKLERVFRSISCQNRGKPLSRPKALPDNKQLPATFPKKQS